MGNTGAVAVGMAEAPVTVEQSISGMLAKVIFPKSVFSYCTDIV
jgi:hypothetical protein